MDHSEGEEEGEEGQQEQILYDIVTYREWEQEPEVVRRAEGGLYTGGRAGWLGAAPGGPLPQGVEAVQGAGLPWHLAVSPDGAFIAVLQEAVLEVWSSREQYSTLVGRRPVERDPAPQWRRLQWAEDASLLAVAQSSGAVELCDTVGNSVYTIISPMIPASQPGWADSLRAGASPHSYCAIFFTCVRLPRPPSGQWAAELVLVELSGRITSFLVSPSGYQELSSWRGGWGLTAAAHCPAHGLLITAGGLNCPLTGRRRLVGRASSHGIVALRLLADSPHYASTLDAEELGELAAYTGFSLPFLSSSRQPTDCVTALAVSACGARLAALHHSGALSVWSLPGFLLQSTVLLAEQPGFDECNPQLLQAPHRRRAKAEFLANPLRYQPVALAWWSRDAVVLARMSGALTVLGTQHLSNLLGDSPEFLEGVPRISHCLEKGFFGLECDMSVRGRRPSVLDQSAGEDPDVELEDSEGEEEEGLAGWLATGKRGASALAFYVTDSETFAPPKKKARVVRKTYRLMGLVSTSPEELYGRKIAAEEYGEAIMLAQHYGLDTDLVYERQWRRSAKTGAAIQDYLAKMRRRGPVLQEVLHTLPEDIDATRQLLEYGLKGTDLEALLALGPDRPAGPEQELFVLCDPQRVAEDGLEEGEREEREGAARQALVARVRWQELTLLQKDLVSARIQLLYYLDCLDTVEDILGGGQRAADRFDSAAYAALRRRSPLENCVVAARAGDCDTLAGVLASGEQAAALAPHWLALLSCLPETARPAAYGPLLPGVEDGRVTEPWRRPARDPDWAERPVAARWSGHRPPTGDPETLLYSEPELAECRQYCAVTPPTPGLVSRWYESRARAICRQSSLPGPALALLQEGLQRGVPLDWRLLHHLRTLDSLVYEVQVDMELAALEALEPVQQMAALLEGWRAEPLLTVRRQLVPFLQRLEDHAPGEMARLLAGYCAAQAATDLAFPLLVVEQSGPDKAGPILYSVVDTVRLALDCCYALEAGGQLDLVERMWQSVVVYVRENPQTRQMRYNVSRALVAEVEQLRGHLDTLAVLARHGVMRPLALLRDKAGDPASMQRLLAAVLARAEGARPPLEPDGWRAVWRDLQALQVLLPAVPVEGIVHSYCESLLASGRAATVALAGPLLEGRMGPEEQVELVVTAWTHYYSTAGGLADPALDLARQVLGLLQPTPRQLDRCYDLLAALQSMEDFGLGSVLPLTILECGDRLELVRRAVEARPAAYKNSQRLMKLGSLLRAAGEARLEGEVWAVIARRALQLRDHASSLAACSNMIRLGFTGGWQVCYALAAKADFSDLERSKELLAFAVCHCQGEELEAVLRTLVTVEHRRLGQKLALQVETDREEDEEEEGEERFEDTVEEVEQAVERRSDRDGTPVEQLLHVPSLSAQFLARHAAPAVLWRHTAAWGATHLAHLSAPPAARGGEDEIIDREFEAVRLPAFYLLPDSPELEGALDAAYDRYVRRDPGLAPLLLLRMEGLARSLGGEEGGGVEPALLRQLVPLVAGQDLALGLLLLLQLGEPAAAVPALAALPRSLPALCLSLAYFSLAAVADRLEAEGGRPAGALQLAPRQAVRRALQLRREAEGDAAGATPGSRLCFQQMTDYLELATDYHQGNLLSSLSGDVDVSRFTSDPEYKEDTILGLALFTEPDKWQFTLSLAQRYGLPLARVAAAHTAALLNELPCAEAARLLEERGLVGLMGGARDGGPAGQALQEKVLPLVAGEDTERLLLYYSVQAELGREVGRHPAALQRLQAAGVTLDYSLLAAGSSQLLHLLSEDNVEVVAELVELLGTEGGVTASAVCAAWAAQAFLQHGRAKGNWIEAFSLCQTFIDRMLPEDFRGLVRACILSAESLALVPRPARGRIFKKAVKQVEVGLVLAPAAWAATAAWLQGVRDHSERFRQQLTIDTIAELGEAGAGAVDRLEMTGGEEGEVLELLAGLVLEGGEGRLVEGVMAIWKQSHSVEGAGLELVAAVCRQVLGEGPAVTPRPLELLAALASPRPLQLPGRRVAALLAPLATHQAVTVTDRLAILTIIRALEVGTAEGEEEGSPELDSSFLAELYSVQQEVEEVLPGVSVSGPDLETEAGRSLLLGRLLAACTSAGQAGRVGRLAAGWRLPGHRAALTSCLLHLGPDGQQAALELLEEVEGLDREEAEGLDREEAEGLLEGVGEDGLLGAQLVLLLGLEDRYEGAVQAVREATECPPLLARALVRRELAARLAGAPLLPALAAAGLEQGGETAAGLVTQLRAAGHGPLAASIQMQVEGAPPGLRTLASLAQRWLPRAAPS